MDTEGKTFPWQSQYHPHEHVLQITKDDLFALPAAISGFNGFYNKSGKFILINSIHILIALAVLAGLVLIAVVLILVRYIRHRGGARSRRAKPDGATPDLQGQR